MGRSWSDCRLRPPRFIDMNRIRLDPNEGRRQAARQWVGIKAHRLRLSEDLIEEFCALVRDGVAPDTAADKLRVSRTTFRRWLRLGEHFEENEGEPEEYLLYAAFRQSYREARADFLIKLTEESLREDASPRHVRRALEILRRRDAENWCAPAMDRSSMPDEIPEADMRYL